VNDVVLSPHVNRYTCGTGKWSERLAGQLGVPFLALDSHARPWPWRRPLVSARLTEMYQLFPPEHPYDLIIHDWETAKRTWALGARRVYAVTPALVATLVAEGRPDAQLLPCPSSVQGTAEVVGLRMLLFGMAHKRQRHWLIRLRDLLAHEGDYTVSVSTAVHEGSPFDRAMLEAEDAYRELFGDHLRMLGFLADDALVRELKRSDCCALFFDPAARANNTTLWAALEVGCPVITNLDEESPRCLDRAVVNIASVTQLRNELDRPPYHQIPQWAEVVEALGA
jgi:hypothetical protein